MSYPTDIDSFTTKTDNVDKVEASHINALQTAIVAIETHVGTAAIVQVNSQIQLMGTSITPAKTNGCADPGSTILEMSTNKNTIKVPAFDKDTVEYGDWWHELPADYDGGTITYHVNWTHPSTSTNFNVAWALKAVAIGDGGTLDASYGSAIQVNDTGGNTNYLYRSPESSALTIAGSPTAGKLVNWRIYRVANDATNDTLAVDAYLIGVTITYTRTA